MGTRKLIMRYAMAEGFRYEAGEEAGSFVDLLRSDYTVGLKERAAWLTAKVVPLSDEDIDVLVRERMDRWASEFQADQGVVS